MQHACRANYFVTCRDPGWQYQPQMVEVVYKYRLQQKNKQQYNGSKEPMVRCSKGAPLGQIANTGLATVRTITIHTFFILACHSFSEGRYSTACLPGALLSFKPDKLRRTGNYRVI